MIFHCEKCICFCIIYDAFDFGAYFKVNKCDLYPSMYGTSIKSPLILLISNVVRFNLFNLASYGKLFNSGIILVNLRWTPSINLIWPIWCGDQACTAYSRCGLTKLLSSSVYSPLSDKVGLPPHNTPFPGVIMKCIGAAFLRPNALPDVNHMRGMQYQIVLNIIIFGSEIN